MSGDKASFCHIVIPAPDLERAHAFYTSIFGWDVQVNVPGPGYWFFSSGNVDGAFSARARPSTESVVLVLGVEDIESVAERVRESGGEITQEVGEIGDADGGRDAYFLDPNGNAMGLYEAGKGR